MDFKTIKTKTGEAATDGKLSCSDALQLAEELGCDSGEIGKAADELKIKIMQCRLGCF